MRADCRASPAPLDVISDSLLESPPMRLEPADVFSRPSPIRRVRAMLDRLRTGNLSVSDLADPFHMTQPGRCRSICASCATPVSYARNRSGASVSTRSTRGRCADVFEWASLYRGPLQGFGGPRVARPQNSGGSMAIKGARPEDGPHHPSPDRPPAAGNCDRLLYQSVRRHAVVRVGDAGRQGRSRAPAASACR